MCNNFSKKLISFIIKESNSHQSASTRISPYQPHQPHQAALTPHQPVSTCINPYQFLTPLFSKKWVFFAPFLLKRAMSFYADIVKIAHFALVIFITITPFIKNLKWPLLLLHGTSVFTLVTHWLTNQDACFLTLLECTLRGLSEDECRETSFMSRLVSPVYKIQDSSLRQFVLFFTPILGIISCIRLYNVWPEMKTELYDVYYGTNTNASKNSNHM